MSPSLLLLLAACAPYPEGLRITPHGDGPVVMIDWEDEPLPNIPFPNDLATVVDRHSPTGLRLNVPLAASTHMEQHARQKLNTLSGFGVYSPITVAFDAALDLDAIAAAHKDDERLGSERYDDDVVFLIDVDPDSPDFQEIIPVDLGRGRYPMDVPRTDRYFPNDSRGESPSLVFDTVDEDLDGDGELDWGEDTDNDGVLDKPNVHPVGGDPREDLLTFYEKETNTLIIRPVRPLREETTYAVVLTERLTDPDGNPVRSPWRYVHHLRQQEALTPLDSALSGVGLGIDDVAFAWVYTTGRVTGDLRDARRGLLGEGPLASLDAEYPEGVTEASVMHSLDDEDPYLLPTDVLIGTLSNLGLFDSESAEPLVDNYTTFGQAVVGGAFTTPNFFGDDDHAPAPWPEVDDSDDYWQVDSFNGTYQARGERVAFTCVLPKDVPQPAPVGVFGHGYGSSRFDFLAFGWAMNRVGMAACAFDYPGHGPTVDPEDLELIEPVLTNLKLYEFYEHLLDSRYRDLDNDGTPDSGGDQWTADAFHTRDMVRQAALDHAQFVDTLRACGSGTMDKGGEQVVSCDWDGDGTPDIGGPDVSINVLGGSLGGINTAVAATIVDDVDAWAPVVPGGGLLDVAFRTEIGGAVEAMHGRLMSPLFLGYPTEDGGLEIRQMVNSVTDMEERTVAVLDEWPAGGRLVIENLANGEVREGYVPADGTFRLGVPADALSAWEKAREVGLDLSTLEPGDTMPASDTTKLGDPLRLTFQTADGETVAVVDTLEQDFDFHGVTYPAGQPLVALAEGLGKIRGSPDLRRIGFVFSAILEPGDPIAYARAFTEEPFPDGSGEPRNILLIPTPGDSIVSINTGIALARAAGWLDDTVEDPRYGTSVDRWLIDRQVVRGLEEHGPYTCNDGNPCLFDADDLDNGTDDYGAPSDAPLRLVVETDAGVSGLRLPYVEPTGSHGFLTPDPTLAFDINTFATLQVASYFQAGGTELSDDPCLEQGTCDWLAQLEGGDDTDTGGSDTGGGDDTGGGGDTGTAGDTGGGDDTGGGGDTGDGSADTGGVR